MSVQPPLGMARAPSKSSAAIAWSAALNERAKVRRVLFERPRDERMG